MNSDDSEPSTRVWAEHDSHDIGIGEISHAKAVRGAASALASRWLQAAVQLAAGIILARVLSPRDYGIVAIVTAISGFVLILQDFGLTTAGLQAKTLSTRESSLLFYLSVSIGTLLTLGNLAVAPALAALYGISELAPVSMVLSLSFVISAIASQFAVARCRQGQFASVAIADSAGTVAQLVLTLVLAYAGFGYWSLVAGILTQQTIRTCMLIVRTRWCPGRPANIREATSLWRVGASVTGTQILNYLSQAYDTLLVGKFGGTSQAAFYNRAYYLMLFPLQQLTGPLQNVVVPTLSSIRDCEDRLQSFVRRMTILVSYLVLPVYAFLAGFASTIVSLMFGRQWLPAAPIVAILAIAGAARLYANVVGWLSVSLGRSARQFRFTLISQPVTLLLLTVGTVGGTIGIAWAYVISVVIAVPASYLWILKGSGLQLLPLIAVIARPAAISISLYVAAIGIELSIHSEIASLILGIACWLSLMTLCWCCSSAVRSDIASVFRLLQHLVPERIRRWCSLDNDQTAY